MEYPKDQIEELKQIAPSLRIAEEGGNSFILMEQLKLPAHCTPSVADALLCPHPHSGYDSRLFFSVVPAGIPGRTWNGQIRVLDRTWYAASWRCANGLRLAELLMVHLKVLRA